MPPERQRFVIVGAGLAGAATAYHLRACGVDDVVLLEKEPVPGVHASGRNAAMIREAMEEPLLQPLASESAAVLREEKLATLRLTGGLLMGMGEEDASAHVPPVRGHARFCPADGVIDVAALLQSYLRGQDVRYGCELQGFESNEEGVHIETTAGPFEAAVLVNAAGPWAGALGDLPLAALQRHLFTSEVDPDIDPDWPFVWDPEGAYYLRPESGGWLLCACDEGRAAPGDYTASDDVLASLFQKLARHQPGLGEPRIVKRWVGQRTFADDRLPVIGFDPRSPRLFHVAGLGGHGVTLSWSVGRVAAEMLLGGANTIPAFAPGRLVTAIER